MKTLSFKYFQNNNRYNPETFTFQFIPDMNIECVNGTIVFVHLYDMTLFDFLQIYGSSDYNVFFYLINIQDFLFITSLTTNGSELAIRNQHQPSKIYAIVLPINR